MNPQERALLADCAHAGLTQIPKSLPKDTDWLILSRNNISSLQITDLQFFSELFRLDLHNNSIKYITDDFVQYLNTQSDLVNLDISNNELKSIPRTFKTVKFLTTLMISGNRFECKCNNIWMKNWIKDNRESIQDYKEVYCQIESGCSVPFIQLSDADLTCASMFITLESGFPLSNMIKGTGSDHYIFFSDEFSCGYKCRCYTDVLTRALVADCSNLKLIEIPDNLPNYTDWLIVSQNNISSLNEEITQTSFFPHLTILDISENSLDNISNAFYVFTCYTNLIFSSPYNIRYQ